MAPWSHWFMKTMFSQVLLDYSNFLFTYFLDLMAASGNAEAFYDILEGESVELGYHTDYVE